MSGPDPAPRHRGPVPERQAEGRVGRLTDQQRAQLAAAAPADRDRILQEVRLEHVTRSLADAVAEDRLSQGDADSVLDRLSHGEDAHRIRRELRRLGALPRAGRPATPGSGDDSTYTSDDRGPLETMTEHHPEQDHASNGAPRWVKGFGIVGIVLLFLVVIMLLTGHGPGRHMQGLGQTPATEQSVHTGVPAGEWS